MEQSSELRELLLRMYEAISRGDTGAVERLTSRREGSLFIGTDPGEWYEDTDSILKMLRAQAGAEITVVPGEVRAYQEGAVGWVADRGVFRLPDGSEVPFRMTAVFHREDSDWKLVQEHASIAVSNEEALGQDLAG